MINRILCSLIAFTFLVLCAGIARADVLTSYTVTGGGAYCSGGSGVPIGLSGSEFGVNYQLKKGAVNSGSPVAGSGSAISFGNAIFPGTYTVVATNASLTDSALMSGSVVVSINPASYGGMASAAAGTICNGTSTTITLNGQAGSIAGWEYTTNDGDTWTPSSTAANPLLTGPLTLTTYFRASVTNGECSPAYSGIVGVIVDPISVGGTADADASTLCSASATTISLTGQTGTIVRWELSSDGTNWTPNVSTANPLNTGNLTATRHYRAVVHSGLCSEATSDPTVVTVNPASVGGTAAAAARTICSGGATTVSLSGHTGSILRWESSLDGNNWSQISSSANPLDTANLTATTQFRAMVQSAGCTVVDSSVATVTVTPASVGGAATPANGTLCSGSSTTITLGSQTGAILRWESSPDGTNWTAIGSTANPFNTGNLTATKYFQAVVQSGDCLTATSVPAVVVVNPITVGGTAAAQAGVVCSSSATTINLSGQTGTVVRWESSTDGSAWSPIASTADSLNTGNLTVTTQFRAMVQSGACAMVDSAAATVTVDPVSVGGTATPANGTLCSGASTTITLGGQTGAILRWESSPDGTNWTTIGSTANPFNTGNLTAARHFRAVVQSGLCSIALSVPAIVAVNPTTVGGSAVATPNTICSGTSTTITLGDQTGAVVRWEWSTNGATWTPIAATSNSIDTGLLTVTTQFRAMVQSGGCLMVDSSAATVTVNALSSGGTATAALETLCSGAETTISLSGHSGSIVRWESSPDGIQWSPIGATVNPFNTGLLAESTYFRAVVQSGLCGEAISSVALVTAHRPPVITGQPASAVRLVGAGVSFSVSAKNANQYQWRKNGSHINGATASTYTINPVVAGDTASYTCVVSGSGPCTTTTSAAATLEVGSRLVFSSEPVNAAAGAALPAVEVQIQDQSGNDISLSGVMIALTLNGSGTLGGITNVTTDTNGKATFSTLSITKAASGYTLTTSSSGLTAATSSAFTITAALASAYRITAATTTPAPAVGDALTLKLVDQFGNTVTTFNGDKTLTFSGLSVANNGTTYPTVTDKTGAAVNLGEVTTLTFAGGQSSAGGSLVAYKTEAGVALAVTDQTLSSSSAGGYEVVLTVPNVAPVANTGSVARARNTQLRILISNLLTNGTDPNADPVSFVSVSPTSTDGAALYTNATQILYYPQSGHNPASDSFTYTISDGQLTATGIAIVSLLPDPTGLTFNIVSTLVDGSGHPTITFAGIPDYIYKVQRSANLTNWTDLRTTNAPAAGLFQYTDLNPSNPAFYRAINQ